MAMSREELKQLTVQQNSYTSTFDFNAQMETEEYGVGDALTSGLAASVLSGTVGMINSGTAIINMFGGDIERLKTEEILETWNWDDTKDYYMDNKEVIDTIGFAASTFVPATLGLKAAKYAQAAAREVNSKNLVTLGVQKALLPTNQIKRMNSAVKSDTMGTGARSKRLALASKEGFHQAAVETAFAEAAILLSTNQHVTVNPDELGYFEAIWDQRGGAALGYGIGATIGGAVNTAIIFRGLNSVLKGAESGHNELFKDLIGRDSYNNRIGLGDGNRVVESVARLKQASTEFEGLQGADLKEFKRRYEQMYDNVFEEVAELTGETGKLRDVVGRKQIDGHLTPAIMQLVDDPNVSAEAIADLLHGATGISKYDDVDFLFDPAAQPLSVAKDLDEYTELIGEARHGDKWKNPESPVIGDAQYKLARQTAETSNGISMPIDGTMHFRDQIVNADSQLKGRDLLANESVVGTIRHELGHGNTVWIKQLFGSKVFAPVTDEMVKLSRMRRPSYWAAVDSEAKELKKLNAIIEKGGASDDVIQRAGKLQGRADYMNDPLELVADAWAMFNARNPKQRALAESIGKTTLKLLKDNGAVKTRLNIGEKLVGLKSGKTYDTAQWSPTVADRGIPKYDKTSNTVTSGKLGTRINNKNFSVLSTNADDASAHYYAAIKDGKNLPNEVATSWENFYVLTKVQHQLDNGEWTGKITIDVEDGKQIVLDSADENIDMITEFNKAFTEFKSTAASRLNKRELNKSNNTFNQIARIIDADENFAMSNGFDDLADTVAHWTRNNDPAKPTVAKIFYNNPADLSESGTTALAEAISNNVKVLETVENSINAFLKVMDDRYNTGVTQSSLVQTAVDPSWKTSGRGDVADITRSDQLTGMLKTYVADYGKGTSKLQAIAKFNELFKLKLNEEIQRVMTNVAQKVSGSKEAIMELNVLDSLLRQKFYKFAPKVTNPAEAGEFLGKFIDRVTPEKGTSNIQRLLASPQGAAMVEKLGTDNQIWDRGIEELLEKIVNQKSFQSSNLAKLDKMLNTGTTTIKNKSVVDFWKAKIELNSTVVDAKRVVAGARGIGTNLDPEVLYPGGLNTNKYKHRMYVEPTDEALWSYNRKGIIGANTPEELAQKAAQVRAQFGNKVVLRTKEDMEKHFQRTGAYFEDFSLNEYQVNSDMMRKGINWDVAPEPDPNLIAHYINDTAKDWAGTVDNLTELKYSEEFAALQQGDRVAQAYGTLGAGKQKAVRSSFRDAQSIMLNRTSKENSSAWRDAQQNLDKTLTSVFNGLSNLFTSASKTGNYADMDKYMKHHNIPRLYENETGDILRTSVNATDKALAGLVPKLNGIASTLMLRMDYIQPMVNALSMPIMSVPEMNVLMKSIPDIQQQQLAKGLNVTVPNTNFTMGTNMKLQMQAVKEFFTDAGKKHLQRYYDQGIVTNMLREVRQVADDITIDLQDTSSLTKSVLAKVSNGAKVASNFASKPADWAEDFVKFVAARQAELVLDGAGIVDESIRSSTLRTYTTRVHGNYVHAQRPSIFQGFAGQAIGLFQTYQFNLIQSLLSKVGNKDKAAVASMMTIQAGMFGTQSVPGFRALNEYVALNSSEDNDFYSGASDLVGKEASEWLLFGLSSNFTKPVFKMFGADPEGVELYTRGDLNPRTPLLIPTSVDEIPVYAMSTKFIGNILNTARDLSQGVDAGQVLADSLAHNGVNRPLAGVGSLLAGTRTTGKGSLVADLSDISWFARIMRVAGTKTLDESIAVQSFYRTKGFDTVRNDRLQNLGRSAKRMIQSGEYDEQTYNNFFETYATNGGSPEKFGQWLHTQALGASESVIQKLYKSNSSPSGRYLQNILGNDIGGYINTALDNKSYAFGSSE